MDHSDTYEVRLVISLQVGVVGTQLNTRQSTKRVNRAKL